MREGRGWGAVGALVAAHAAYMYAGALCDGAVICMLAACRSFASAALMILAQCNARSTGQALLRQTTTSRFSSFIRKTMTSPSPTLPSFKAELTRA